MNGSKIVLVIRFFAFCIVLFVPTSLHANKKIVYIYGEVAPDGTLAINTTDPVTPYDQMLLTDTGNNGMSDFKDLVEGQGYTIEQKYDQTTILNSDFLSSYDVVIFGLHQKVWSSAEQQAIDVWIRNGGGILMYSDSASGGYYGTVGIRNPVGQKAVNSILSNYGMAVTVDHAGGTRAYKSNADNSNPIVWDQLEFEGEGVSPVAVNPESTAEVLIPLSSANFAGGNSASLGLNDDAVGITFENPEWACMAVNKVGKGHVMAVFDRQPFWNNGPGSDIEKRGNAELLRRVVRYLARDYGNSSQWIDLDIVNGDPSDFQVSFRQWAGGSGQKGFNYIARNNQFSVEHRAELNTGDWRIEAGLSELVSSSPFGDDESETVILRLLPDGDHDKWFARALMTPNGSADPISPPAAGAVAVTVTGDMYIQTDGSAFFSADISGATSQTWSKVSGPGTVNFDNTNAAETSATFSATGTYVVQMSASNSSSNASDRLTVTVLSPSDITIAINSGGNAYSATTGIDYITDEYFNGGGTDVFPDEAVDKTVDDPLYNVARSKNNTFTGYSIPVANSDYRVVLQLAETFYTEDGKRVFDVSVEGAPVIDDLDIHAESGGKWVALSRTFTTNVTDGVLNVSFSASEDNPLINAILVIKQP